jgi:Domain of unknown function (DUF4476)
MNRFLLVCLLWIGLSAAAQRPSFVYIQTEPAQPFVVSMGEQVFKSSHSGYLILSKLTDTVYAITVNFPTTQWPSQYFTLRVNHADKGYLLKDFGDKGWGLMDWQKLTTQFSQQPVSKNQPAGELKSDDDDFASLLAKASGDPSLIASKPVKPQESISIELPVLEAAKKEISITKELPKPKDTTVAELLVVVQSASAKDSLVKENTSTVSDSKPVQTIEQTSQRYIEQKQDSSKTVVYSQAVATSVVTRRAESSTTEGFGLVFVDTYANGNSDTIRLIIPNNTETKAISVTVALPVHCKELATDEHANEFKKQLTLAVIEQKMIAVAKQQLATRCYSTKQVRALSSLFITDQGKYDFLLEAWSSIADKENMISLSNVFVSKETADRFNELLQ